jgi:hypothetical protein
MDPKSYRVSPLVSVLSNGSFIKSLEPTDIASHVPNDGDSYADLPTAVSRCELKILSGTRKTPRLLPLWATWQSLRRQL